MNSQRFKINKEQLQKILNVFLWSFASIVITAVIQSVAAIEFPSEWLWAVPAINTILYAIKKFIEGQNGKII